MVRRVTGAALVALLSVALSGCMGWFVGYSTTDGSSLAAIACPSPSTCYAVGSDAAGAAIIRRTTDGGTTWSTTSGLPAQLTLAAIDCADVAHCVAVGGRNANNGVYTTDAGAHWNVGNVPSNSFGVTAVSCADAQHCWAAEDGFGPLGNHFNVSTNGGATWSALPMINPTVPDAQNVGFSSMVCATTLRCIAVGDETVWVHNPPFPAVPTGRGVLASTTDGGATWQTQTDVAFSGGLACPELNTCLVTGFGSVLRLTSADDGQSWSAHNTRIAGLDTYLDAVSCGDASHCVAVSQFSDNPSGTPDQTPIATSPDAGATWSLQTAPSGTFSLLGVACPSASVCLAAGARLSTATGKSQGAVVLRTLTGGVNWPSISSISPVQGPESGGNQVTIHGVGFGQPGSTPAVHFDLAPASQVQVISGTEIVVTAPHAPGPLPPGGLLVKVTVTNSLGTTPVNVNFPYTYVSAG